MKSNKSRGAPSIITSHLSGISRALLDGERRPAFLKFLDELDDRRGLYALYNEKEELYYVGKASDLPSRLDNHLIDKHSELWETMTLFFVNKSANVSELEGLIIATAQPDGNTQQPKCGADLRKSLGAFLKQDAQLQIKQAIFPNQEKEPDELSGRITLQKLQSVSQSKLATILGVSQSRISQMFSIERKNPGYFRQYIREAGRRDGVLLLLQKAKKFSKK